MDMDGEILVLARGALRLLRAGTTTLAASDVGMSSIPDIQTDEVELLACGAAITVAFGKKGETGGTVERTVLPQSTAPSAHIRCDPPLHYPLQKPAVPVRGIGSHGRRFPSL